MKDVDGARALFEKLSPGDVWAELASGEEGKHLNRVPYGRVADDIAYLFTEPGLEKLCCEFSAKVQYM